MELPQVMPDDILAYLAAVENAANAIACLSGPPLTERRFLLKFPERAQALDRPGLYPGLLGLLGAPNLAQDDLEIWIPAWQAAFHAVSPDAAPARLDPARERYYMAAFDAILASDRPLAVLWPMLCTWTLAAALQPIDAPEVVVWREIVMRLGLQGESFMERFQALDSYLDLVEETLESWAQDRGVW